MMKVYENRTVTKEVIELLKGTSRARGWSISRLVACPKSSYYWRLGTKWEPADEEALQLNFARGAAHHGILEVYKDREKFLERDRITGHYDMRGRRIFEIFTTTLSSSQVRDDQPMDAVLVFPVKVAQLKCYLYMEGETEGDLMIYFLMGDYTRPIKPRLRAFTLYFTENELKSHWAGILKKKSNIEDCVKQKIPPEGAGEEYECMNCGYAKPCLEDMQKEIDKLRGSVVL